MVSASRYAVEPEDRNYSERRIVESSGCPCVPRKLTAWAVVRVCTEDAHAGRVGGAVVGSDVADDVVGYRGRYAIACVVQPVGEMRRAKQALLFAGVNGEHDCRIQAVRIALRKYTCELDDRRAAGSVVVSTGSVGCEIEPVDVADARIVVTANDDHSAGVTSAQP